MKGPGWFQYLPPGSTRQDGGKQQEQAQALKSRKWRLRNQMPNLILSGAIVPELMINITWTSRFSEVISRVIGGVFASLKKLNSSVRATHSLTFQ